MSAVEPRDDSVRDAQEALDALYATRVQVRETNLKPVFDLKEVKSDDRPVLIQCCIR